MSPLLVPGQQDAASVGLGTRDDVIEGQVLQGLPLPAILAGVAVPGQHVGSAELDPGPGLFDVLVQRDHGGPVHLTLGGAELPPFVVLYEVGLAALDQAHGAGEGDDLHGAVVGVEGEGKHGSTLALVGRHSRKDEVVLVLFCQDGALAPIRTGISTLGG